tara:strand:- start:137522 stop:140776 length:3255 start_codon:yes stop_codon:yes gene_type:complete
MVRGNRKFIVASTLLALPVALVMASFTTGTSPDSLGSPNDLLRTGSAQADSGSTQADLEPGGVAHAGGIAPIESSGIRQAGAVPAQSAGVIQQVGLLESFAEKRAQVAASRSAQGNSSTSKPAPRTASSGSSSGLLSGLFGGSNQPQPTPAAAKPVAERPVADWNGIPYHEPRVVARSKANEPIRDPSAQPTTRIITGRVGSSVAAAPVSVRRETRVILPRPVPKTRVIKPLTLPQPSPEATASSRRTGSVAATDTEAAITDVPLSSSNSSRRSDRRRVEVLDPSIVKSVTTSTSTSTKQVESRIEEELVPKVSRRRLVPEKEEIAKTEKPAEKPVADKPATGNAVALAPAPKKPSTSASTETDKVSAKATQPKPVATRADVAVKKQDKETPAPKTSPAPTAEATVKVSPKSTLLPPTAKASPEANASSTAGSPAAPAPYTMPMDGPAAESVPLAATSPVPSQPYAASTPTAPISHRAGPPASEFQPRQVIVSSPVEATTPSTQFDTASSPIGSGLLPQLPGPNSRSDAVNPRDEAADAYIAAVPQYENEYRRADSAIEQLQAPPATTPLHTTRPQVASPDSGFVATSPDSDLRESTTRRLKPGDTAVASELPGIRVVTHGPSEIMIRQTQQYEIRVENRGSIDAQGVMVRAMIPDWADVRGHNATRGSVTPQAKNSKSQDTFNIGTGERLVWTIDHLPAGASERMFIRLRAERSGSHGVDVDWTLVPQKSVTKVHVHEPQLSLVIDGPPEVIYGRSQTYKVRVMNPGDGVAPNVTFTLSPNSATPQTQRIGDIPAGKEAQFEVELTAQDLGDLKIHGLASGDLELRAEASKTIHVAAAKLEAIMNGPELKYQNTEAVYQLTIENNGNAMTEQVVATLQLPGGAKYLGGIADSLQRGQVVKWKIDALAPGAVREYEFRCNMASTGDQLFTFDCQGTAAAETSVSIATRVESIADLVLTIDDPVAPAPVSTEVAYEIVVRNRGSREATDVRAIAQFSHGIEPKRLEGHSGEVLTGQVLFDPIPRIGAGEEIRLRIVAEAQRAGHHRFRSEVRSGATVLVAEEATHYMNPKSDRVSRSSSENKVLR